MSSKPVASPKTGVAAPAVSRRAYLAGASMLALGVALAAPAPAVAQTEVTISASRGQYTNGVYIDLTVLNAVTISAGNTALLNSIAGTIGTLTNNGAISGSISGGGNSNQATGIHNSGSIGTLTNSATIDGTISGGSSNRAIGIYNSGSISTLTNSGAITATISGGSSNQA
jgi:hypothetical protein